MASLDLSLPDDLNRFVEVQAKVAGLENPAEYVRTLISRAKLGTERLESLLIEGLDSGEPIRYDDGARDALHRQVRDRRSEC
jgi:antitoxin ParD1/3/4